MASRRYTLAVAEVTVAMDGNNKSSKMRFFFEHLIS